MEDRIVGPLTLKQFGYLAVSGIGIMFCNILPLPKILFLIISALLAGAGMAMAFVKVDGRPLPYLVSAFISFMWQPRLYVWKPGNDIAIEKNQTSMREAVGGIDLEKLIFGLTLKSAWRHVQTGSKPADDPEIEQPTQKASPLEAYHVFRKITGEKEAARRIDYR